MATPTLDPIDITIEDGRLEGETTAFRILDLQALGLSDAYADADGDPMGAAIEWLDVRAGGWQYSHDGETWLDVRVDLVNSSTNTLALLLAPTDWLRVTRPEALPTGAQLADALTLRAWDMSSGEAGTYEVTTPGSGAFSAGTATLAMNFEGVDDLPQLVSGPGIAIALSATARLAVDADGVVYGGRQNELVKVDEDGNLVILMTAPEIFHGLVVQADGKLLALTRGALYRFTKSGELDTSFSGDGMAGFATMAAMSMVIQSDGGILVVGWKGQNVVMQRLLPDGTTDSAFNGGQAVALNSYQNQGGVWSDVRVDADGRIVTVVADDFGTRLARYLPDGTLDTSFGTAGVAQTAFRRSIELVLEIDPDGRILLNGATGSQFFPAHFLARFTSDGLLDTSFGADGMVDGAVFSLAFQSTGKIIASQGALLRYEEDGTRDVTFMPSTGGVMVAALPGDGLMVANGVQLGRILPDGALDAGFAAEPFGGPAAFTEGSALVHLVRTASLLDEELAATRSYGGLSLQLTRADGANADDAFGAVPGSDVNLWSNNAMLVRGTIVGTWSGSDGQLTITFSAIATQRDVDTVLNAIGYHNKSEAPSASVQIAWTLSGGPLGDVSTVATSTVNIAAINDAPTLGFGGSLDTVERGPAVALDTAAAAADFELAAQGHYAGASATFARSGGAHAEDSFAALGDLVMEAGTLTLDGVAIGTCTQAGGVLTLVFDQDATGARVNEALASIGYTNTSHLPPAGVVIALTFSDGNTGAQGSGGALAITRTVSVSIESVTERFTGTAGADSLSGTVDGDVLDGRGGNDTMAGGARNDTYIVDANRDTVVETAGGGDDTAVLVGYVDWDLPQNVENIMLGARAEKARGNDAANGITGNGGNNELVGHGGADTLTGRGGADHFAYRDASDSRPGAMDRITDFNAAEGDRIDLGAIDPKPSARGDQAFKFIGAAPFGADATGQLRFEAGVLYGSTDADAEPEFAIELTGVTSLAATAIVL